jgi:hypothetical protein
MKLRIAIAAGLIAFASFSGAWAFGTIAGMGQNQEHERITRHALGCDQGRLAAGCFQPKSLDEIAGARGTWGAVGAPDDPARGLLLSSEAHCDNGDWLPAPGYPHSQSEAREALTRCRAAMSAHLDEAVRDSARLLDAGGDIDDAQIPARIACSYLGHKGRAKCDVLEDLGLALHAAQDFYAHSNWVDHAAPGPVTLENPAGLAQAGPAPWLDLREERTFPDGLITGCFDTLSLVSPASGCAGHVKHEYLNKDKGRIDPAIGAGATHRGQVDDNFRRAVEAAIADTRDKWATLQERLVAAYGPARAQRMVCAITHDRPATDCR